VANAHRINPSVLFGLVGRGTTSARQFFLRHLGSGNLQRPSNHCVSILGISQGFSDFARGDDLVDSVACASDWPAESLIFLAEQINATLIVGLFLIVSAVAAVSVADAKEAGQRLFEP
jgi:hypothetical protein